MDDEQRRDAKKQMMELMQAGQSWQEAAHHAGVQTSRSTAYRWWQAYRRQGDAALLDGRHGHLFLPSLLLVSTSMGIASQSMLTS